MTGPDAVVLAGVVVFLGSYLIRCHQLSLRAGSDLPNLAHGFKDDIVSRARRGQDPDWLRYVDESDRRHEYTCERLRNFATAALATGIGGTMSLVFLNLLNGQESGDAVRTLLQAMGSALIPSVGGVFANLLILLWLLPRADRRYDVKRKDYVERLRDVSETHPPRTPVEGLKDTVNEKLEQFLESTAHNFPRVIEGFRESVAGLGDVSTTFHTSTVKMESASAVLLSSITELNALPANLGNELTKARKEWTSEVRESQAQYLSEFRRVLAEQDEAVRKTLSALEDSQAKSAEAEARRRHYQVEEQKRHEKEVLRLVNATIDVERAVEQLPQGFRKEIDRASESLGRVFGSEARNHVTDLIDAIGRGNDELKKELEGHVRQMLNEMGDMVQQGLKPTLEGIARIGGNLEAAGRELRKSIGDFAVHGDSFRSSLQGAARQIEESSAQLAGVHDKTRTSISEIQERYRKMHQVLSESIKEVESLLERLVEARKQPAKYSFLNRIRAFVKGRRGPGVIG